MSKILNFEKFIRMNEMESIDEGQAPVADVLKTAKGQTIKAVRMGADDELPPITQGSVFVYMTPPSSDSPDGEIKFDRGQSSITFSSENFDPRYKGAFETQGSDDPKLLGKPGKIGSSAYGILWHLATILTGSPRPDEQDLVDTLNALKKIKTVQSYKAIADKNKNFNEFYTSLQLNAADPSKALGTGTFASIPGIDSKVIQTLEKTAKETLLA
jgi:hypothetical protein